MTVFKLLEISIISAQDLPPVSKMLRTFAASYINPDQRLTTKVDHLGNCNPTWNHKVTFNIDERFLKSKSSAVTIEIYNVAWLRDLPIGTAHLFVNILSPPLDKNPSFRRVSLQVRRPSGLLKGTLNVGIQLLDSHVPGLNKICNSRVGNEEKLDHVDRDDEKEDFMIEASAGPQMNQDPQILASKSEDLTQTQEEKTINMPEPDGTSMDGSENVRKWLQSNENEEYGSSIFENWTETGGKSEEVKLKPKSVKRRLTENDQIPLRNVKKSSHHKRGSSEGKGLLSCFGNAYGFQFSLICGSKKSKKKMKQHGFKNTQNFSLM